MTSFLVVTAKRTALVVLLILFSAMAVHAQMQNVADRIVAVVGNEIITQSDLDYQVQLYVFQNRIDPAAAGLKRQVLDALVNEKLLLAQSILDSVTVSDEEITQRLDAQIQALIQQYSSEAKVEETYGMPISRMKREFRDDVKKQILIGKVQQTKLGSVQISRRDVEAFYAAYRDSLPKVPASIEISHIFMIPKLSSKALTAALVKVQAIEDSLKAGADFAELAKRLSEDPGSAANGGDLGWVRRGELVKAFEEVAFSMKENEISKPVLTEFGYHIIQLVGRRGEQVHARQILIKVQRTEEDNDSTVVLFNRIRKGVMAGASFAAMAQKYSEDEETKDLGGDLGVVPLTQLSPEMQSVVDTLKPGEISAPVKLVVGSKTGYHILLLKKKIPEHAMNLADDYKYVEQYALTQKRNQEFTKWIAELKKRIYWEERL